MSGLSYLCEYGESDESESESGNRDIITEKLKLPVPDLSKVSIIPIDEHFDNPQQHNGRIRTFPHVRGNWATYAYIKYIERRAWGSLDDPEDDYIHELLNKFKLILKSTVEPSHTCDNLHVSVSKTVVLKYHLISSFTTSLQKEINGLESFDLGFDAVEIYTNEEKSRTFVALKADFLSRKFLLQITDKIDGVLEDFGLPKFYEAPSFHMSVLWWNGNQKESISKHTEDLNAILNREKEDFTVVNIQKVDCKVGNKYYQFHLD